VRQEPNNEAEVQVALVVYINGEEAMAYCVKDAWPNDDKTTVDRVKDAIEQVVQISNENF
jgi:hypothetical protein